MVFPKIRKDPFQWLPNRLSLSMMLGAVLRDLPNGPL